MRQRYNPRQICSGSELQVFPGTSPTKTCTRVFLSDWTKDLKTYFTREDTQMANRQMRKVSTSLAVGERHVTSTRRRHRTPVRMATIELLTPRYCCGCVCGGRSVKLSSRSGKQFAVSLKTKRASTVHPAVALLPIYSREMKAGIYTKTCTQRSTTALFPIVSLETPQMSLSERMFQVC